MEIENFQMEKAWERLRASWGDICRWCSLALLGPAFQCCTASCSDQYISSEIEEQVKLYFSEYSKKHKIFIKVRKQMILGEVRGFSFSVLGILPHIRDGNNRGRKLGTQNSICTLTLITRTVTVTLKPGLRRCIHATLPVDTGFRRHEPMSSVQR